MAGYVQKLRALVRVLLAGDEPVDGVMCLAPYSRSHDGPQTLLELLNSGDRMIPLEGLDDPAVHLLTRAEIVWAAPHAGVEARLQRPLVKLQSEEHVRIRLSDGTQLEGLLQLERIGELNRASDFLNLGDDFFAVETDEGLLFVNKLRVRDVRLFSAAPLPVEQD
jgi:hypothetical protein